MNNETLTPFTSKTAGFIFAGLLATVLLSALGKETGFLDPGLAKRAVGASFGGLLMVIGNFLPKLVLPLPESEDGPGQSSAAARFAGWTFVVAGLVYTAIWILAPLAHVELVSSLIGMGAFGLVAANYARRGGRHIIGVREKFLIMLLLGLFWMFAIFLMDYAFGDRAAQWTAIVFVIVMGVAVNTLRKGQDTEPED